MVRYRYGKPVCLLVLGVVMGVQMFFWRNAETSIFVSTAVRPRMMDHLPYGERDDFRQGRSCFYQETRRFPWFFTWSEENPWLCQECVAGACKILRPKSRCPPVRRRKVDQVPRVRTEPSPMTEHKSYTLVLHHYYDAPTEYEIPACTGTLSLPCFDLTRCGRFGPVKVYAYGTTVEAMLDKAIQEAKGVDAIQKTDNPANACLLVVGEGSFDRPQQLLEQKHWRGGQNHYIFNSSSLLETDRDGLLNTKYNFGMAATSPMSMDDAYSREGYDTPLGLYPRWQRPGRYDELDLHRKRRLLLYFKVTSMSLGQQFWQHWWIASEYWESKKDVYVDGNCGHKGSLRDDNQKAEINPKRKYNQDDNPMAYKKILMNSTFVFCPGGGTSGVHQATLVNIDQHLKKFDFSCLLSLRNRW